MELAILTGEARCTPTSHRSSNHYKCHPDFETIYVSELALALAMPRGEMIPFRNPLDGWEIYLLTCRFLSKRKRLALLTAERSPESW